MAVTTPPIIPGSSEQPATLASVMPAPPPPHQPRWAIPVIGALVLLVLAGAGTAVWALTTRPASETTSPTGTTSSPPTLPQTTPAAKTYPTPAATDFAVTVNVITKKCFGSAGCSITYKIDVMYNGPATEPNKVWYVTYEISGGDDPEINTFQFKSTSSTKYTVSVPREQLIDTPNAESVLTAAVTRVSDH